MRSPDYFKDKKVAIIGLARSGLASASLLHSLGAEVSVSDSRDDQSLRLNASGLFSKGIKVELGGHTRGFIEGRDIAVVSPGVPDESPAIAWAEQAAIPLISEIELGWMLCAGTVIAVTGSSGKTTVTTLIGRALQAASKGRIFVCGNIGNPFCAEVDKISRADYAVLEVSSFQLARTRYFKPKIALFTNFAANHLDRHRDMQEYLGAKKKIFANQDKDDYLVLNSCDPVSKGLAAEAKSNVVFFSKEKGMDLNQSAVSAVGGILGIGRAVMEKVFREFGGLEHRMELVAEAGGVKFINDSKATTADSTVWALENISGPVILIAGGKDKGVNYGAILQAASAKVKEVILLGEAKEKIASALSGALAVSSVKTLDEAVRRAFNKAVAGDHILLSPMCSSFDMFSGYEERGRVFKGCVSEIIKERGRACRRD